MSDRNEIEMEKARKRSIKCLEEKKEGFNTYPISESDLLKVDECNLCSSREISPIAEVHLDKGLNFFSTSTCNDCLYTFRSVSPSLEWFKKCWRKIATGTLEVFNPEVERIRKRRYEDCHEVLSKHVQTGIVLDIGAAYGTGAKVFQDHGFTVETIEPEDNKANYIEKALQIPVRSRSLEDFITQKEDYDLIILSHCLEHLDDPRYVISNIKNLLNPNGILYLEVPTLWNEVTWSDAFFMTHKSNLTEENTIDLVTQSGFQVLETVYFRHAVDEPWDIGLVLKPTQGNAETRSKPKYTVDDVRRLYRKNMPLATPPPLGQVLRYSVPYIEHFYQTIKMDRHRIIEPKDSSDFISFEPQKS